jgi:hypothetical protein
MDSLFDKWYWENWISTCKRPKLGSSLSPCTSIKSKKIKDLNVKSGERERERVREREREDMIY